MSPRSRSPQATHVSSHRWESRPWRCSAIHWWLTTPRSGSFCGRDRDHTTATRSPMRHRPIVVHNTGAPTKTAAIDDKTDTPSDSDRDGLGSHVYEGFDDGQPGRKRWKARLRKAFYWYPTPLTTKPQGQDATGGVRESSASHRVYAARSSVSSSSSLASASWMAAADRL